jgi:small-conductance mechanosensitive channel
MDKELLVHIHVVNLAVICIIAGLAYWANDQLNRVPVLNNVIKVVIIVVAILLVLQSLGTIEGTTGVTVN